MSINAIDITWPIKCHSINSMNPNREELLFQRALTKPAAERAAWLDRECGDDKALRARLDALLAAHEQPETLLATQTESARSTIKPDFPDAPDEAVGRRWDAANCSSESARVAVAWSASSSWKSKRRMESPAGSIAPHLSVRQCG